MTTIRTTRVALRLSTEIYEAIQTASAEAGVEVSDFIKDTLAQAVMRYLPQTTQDYILNAKKLYEVAQAKARDIDALGSFDEHFTLTVIKSLTSDLETRKLYEKVINADAMDKGAPGKTPVNMYLGWYIKNAINAVPLLDAAGKVRRAFVENQAIQSYTLLAKP